MNNFNDTMQMIWAVEHNKNPSLIIHKNKGERKYTFYGIYPHTKLPSYKVIERVVHNNSYRLRQSSIELYDNPMLYKEVLAIYKKDFWDRLQLDRIDSVHITKEIMVFAINIGLGTDWRGINRKKYIIRCIQEIVGTTQDGVLGEITIRHINSLSDKEIDRFSLLFDKYEISFYRALVRAVPRLGKFINGWIKRAKTV